MDHLIINEIFDGIQGEGRHVGTPATFLRLQGCNLRCEWCDTPEALDADEGACITVGDAADELLRRSPGTIIITGGEPMLQMVALSQLISLIRPRKSIHVETNGTYEVPRVFDWVTVSPKPPWYYMDPYIRPSELKIVVFDDESLTRAFEVVRGNPLIPVYLQAVNNERRWLKAIYAKVVRSSAWNVRMGFQLHKMIGVK